MFHRFPSGSSSPYPITTSTPTSRALSKNAFTLAHWAIPSAGSFSKYDASSASSSMKYRGKKVEKVVSGKTARLTFWAAASYGVGKGGARDGRSRVRVSNGLGQMVRDKFE